MNMEFAFGKSGLEVSLPNGPRYELIKTRTGEPLTNIEGSITAALESPIGCASLTSLALGKKTAAISVCDITRPAPNAITLPPLLSCLHHAGIQPENVTIFIATGLHRAATAEELAIILGPRIVSAYKIVNHDAKDLSAHRHLGQTERGTPVYIEERFMAADLHISLGFIEQHLMLGFSGGRKLIAPGLAAQQTIKVIHSPKFMREKMATEGSVRENPLHTELLEIARMARHDFILDVTLTKSRAISGVFAGDPTEAHAAGVQFIRDSSLQLVPNFVDAVITSAAGYPLDLTFYQTIKGITAAQHILKPGGEILVLAECAEGIGSQEFAAKLRSYAGPQAYLDEIESTSVDVDQWQLEKLALVNLKHPISLYAPGISENNLGMLRSSYHRSVDAAIQSLVERLPGAPRIALVPDGPYSFARVKEQR